MNRLSFFLLIFFFVTLIQIPYTNGMELRCHENTIDGRIFEATTSESGIPNLTVRLIPPKDVKKPEKITTTDQDGRFHFMDLDEKRYLLEVYQGVTLLHRDVIDTSKCPENKIRLKRRE